MPALGLKVNLGIRDYWDKEDGTLQTSLKALKEVLGYEVVIKPEWPLLLAELDKFYPDKTNFVNVVAGTVATWAKATTALLDDEDNEKWSETLLEKLSSSWSRLNILLEVSKNEKASTEWSDQRGGFIVYLAKRAVSQPLEFLNVFRGQVLAAFEPAGKSLAHHAAAAASSSGNGAGDDWADVEMDRATGGLAVVEKTTIVAGSAPDRAVYFPNFQGLPRPDDLLTRPPYHLMVYARGATEIEVQCSHSPTLQLLNDYLKKWCRTNHNQTTRPPSVEIKLFQAAFGLGLIYDRLLLQVDNRYGVYTITPAIILSLVEGSLGYEKVYSDGHSWTFRKDTEFKTM